MLLEKIRLEPDEEILLQTRRHWFVITIQIIGAVLAAIIPPIALVVVQSTLDQYSATISLESLIGELLYLYFFLLIFVWILIFNIWTNFYLDVLTVTDRRVILVNQKGFFWRNIASFRLERMQDMNTEINGIIATLLDYGTIVVETAGHSEEEFRATNLPHPSNIKSIILQAADNRITTSPNHDGLQT